MQAMDIRRRGERRRFAKQPEYPFRDSEGVWVTHNRRRLVDRRYNRSALDSLEAAKDVNLGSLMLHYRDQVLNLPARDDAFVLGRRQNCHLVVEQDFVSREHARIVFRHGHFLLIDQSLNGTYIRRQNGEVQHLHQGEQVLTGSGYISLGQTLTENRDNLIYFFHREPQQQRAETSASR
jgi:pSer/pThr/pTyr-binding forkhead associated (FHA) protein